jgi:hypothetical protein
MTPLDRTRLEKALADHGFDLSSVLEGDWLVGRSTQHPTTVCLQTMQDGTIAIATGNAKLRSALNKEGYGPIEGAALPEWAKWQVVAADFNTFYALLGRVAALSRSLPNQVAERFARVCKTLPMTTEAERLVVQRIGQNLFREALIDYWQGRCAVTGLDVVPLLCASHIKPWAACASDEERLDVFNGLLLAPHLDALFDGGWITFSETGEMRMSQRLTLEQQAAMGVSMLYPTLELSPECQAYMSYHRIFIFK